MLVGPELIRAINKQRVLRLVRSAGALSRADLAERTGLTRPTVSAVVAELLEEGWVEEIGTGESSGGRPPILLRFNPRARWVVGAELGAGHVRAVLSDLAGNVVHRVKQRVESHDPMVEIGQLERAIRQLLARAGEITPSTPVAGIGIGITGVIDTEEGIWRYSPHYKVRDLPVVQMLEERTGLPVWIENDARAMAWGERSFGAAQGVDNLAFIRVGIGLGAGIIIDGKLYGGAHQGAGEIGHIIVKERGLRCRCGSDGCLETVGSAVAIARRAAQRLAHGEETLIRELAQGDPSRVIATTVIEAAYAGDRVAQEILSEAGRYLGIGIGSMINLLNPAMVIIGGGTSRAGDFLIEPLREAALERTLPALRDKVKIVRTTLGEDAGPLGGAALVIEELFRTPTLK